MKSAMPDTLNVTWGASRPSIRFKHVAILHGEWRPLPATVGPAQRGYFKGRGNDGNEITHYGGIDTLPEGVWDAIADVWMALEWLE